MNATAMVNIDMDYEDENDAVYTYVRIFRPSDWSSDDYTFEHHLTHDQDSLNLITEKRKLLIECSLAEKPQKLSKLVSEEIKLCYASTYVFIVKACSDQGVCTNDEDAATIEFKTPEHTPTCPPGNVNIVSTGTNSLQVSFDALDHFCAHGEIVNYHLLLFESNKLERLTNFNEMNATTLLPEADFTQGADSGSSEFTGLEEYWSYTVVLFAENQIGYGLVSQPQSAVTDEHGKYFCCFLFMRM